MKVLQSLARPLLGLLLVSGVATAAVVTNARPAQAGVVVSIGFGGYAPGYHRYWRRGAYFGYRRYAPPVWGVPVVYGPPPAYAYPGPILFRRPYYYAHYGRPYGYGYGPGYRYGHYYGYGRGYAGYRYHR